MKKSELSDEPIEYPEKVFYPGQVVQCTIKYCLAEEEKLMLSFKVGTSLYYIELVFMW